MSAVEWYIVFMFTFITIIEVASASLLSLCILIQHRASGLSATFGGSGAVAIQRRGAEKVIFQATVWFSVIFFGLAVLQWYL